ncbi:hypothetical protein ACWGID_26675 [Kribbella sp. NPDC054772]
MHALESWEANNNNNSFAAVSPDVQWMVTGEWGTMDRLLVLPMPGVAATDPAGRPQRRHRPRHVAGQLPLRSVCSGQFEVEGVDYSEYDETLRVVVMSPGVCGGNRQQDVPLPALRTRSRITLSEPWNPGAAGSVPWRAPS